jgi:hypothetical protein
MELQYAMNIKSCITNVLTPDKSLTSTQIASVTNYSKREINVALTQLQQSGRVRTVINSFPTEWMLYNPQAQVAVAEVESKQIPIVMVDLGNVHDTLDKLCRYADQGIVKVYAFADMAFNGYGINPRPPTSIEVFQSDSPDKNAADIEMIAKCVELSLNSPDPLDFYIVTKDQGFRRLSNVVKRQGHSMTFVTNWEGLRMFIE